MSVARSPWDLPGPAAFVTKVVEKAHDSGIVAVIAPAHCPSDLDAVFRDQLGVLDLPTIDAREGALPLQALSRAFNMELISARSLPSATEAEGRAAFVAGLDRVSAVQWETTLRAFLAGCRQRRRFGAMLLIGASPDCQS